MTGAGPRRAGRLVYGLAAGIGLAASLFMLPPGTMLGSGGMWAMPGGDPAMSLTGHLAYQDSPWRWPLLLASHLAWPDGRSIAMTDSNPLVSMIAKGVAGAAGHHVNLLGAWIMACWALQPVAAVWALRSFGPARSVRGHWMAAAAVAVLSLLCPAWLMRYRHVNLLGHFLLLAALGLTLRMLRPAGRRSWRAACALLTAAILIHPYMFVYAAILLAAPVIREMLQDGWPAWRIGTRYVAACVAPVLLLWVLSSSLGARASGYGHYSMNLLSPFVPQLSGLFGPALPIIDATGGQYEGFNYLGAGVLLLTALAAVAMWRRPNAGAPGRLAGIALLLPLAGLTALALSPRVYAGRWLVLPLPLWPWNLLAACVQSSGRAFWAVGYAVMIGAVACLAARLRPAGLAAVLGLAIGLQAADTGPVRALAAGFYRGDGQVAPVFAMPDGATLLRVVPECDRITAVADRLRVAAAKRGMRLADMRMARQPDGFDCETALADGLETALAANEVRFFLPEAAGGLRLATLGAGTVCRRGEAGVLCTRDQPNPWPYPDAASGNPLPSLGAQASDGLAPLLSFGWRRAGGGPAWSEGPEATLLFKLADLASAAGTLDIDLDGVARQPGGARAVSVQVNGDPAASFSLQDLRRTHIRIALPGGRGPGAMRVVFRMRHPVDPAARHLPAFVSRAAIRLYAVRIGPAR